MAAHRSLSNFTKDSEIMWHCDSDSDIISEIMAKWKRRGDIACMINVSSDSFKEGSYAGG